MFKGNTCKEYCKFCHYDEGKQCSLNAEKCSKACGSKGEGCLPKKLAGLGDLLIAQGKCAYFPACAACRLDTIVENIKHVDDLDAFKKLAKLAADAEKLAADAEDDGHSEE